MNLVKNWTPSRRHTSEGLEQVLFTTAPVGKDGFVMPVDYMGNDAVVVERARLSYGAGTTRLLEDRGLLRYLMRHWHTSPSEMAVIVFHVRAPLYVARQWMRHRMGSFNEYSGRYSEMIDSIETTPANEWRSQSTTNRQGSGGMLEERGQEAADMLEDMAYAQAKDSYQGLLAIGTAREQARKVLPVANYTEFVWKVDLHNLLQFLRLRLDAHAQKEIRDFAEAISDAVRLWVPDTWQAFEDYRLLAMTLTRLDIEVMKPLVQAMQWDELSDDYAHWVGEAVEIARSFGWMEHQDDGPLKNNRERAEFEVKMGNLGVLVPWKVG